ncbi:hypothetical protein [Streptosporangium roseum]|uniref:hypothetical protein n=1 Tax=Streptosporangium roseum TaxID=2001 RepID=UPI0031ED8B29
MTTRTSTPGWNRAAFAPITRREAAGLCVRVRHSRTSSPPTLTRNRESPLKASDPTALP